MAKPVVEDFVHASWYHSPGSHWPRNGLEIRWTRCHFGGERAWLKCEGCGRRCGKLYVRPVWPDVDRGDHYRCRLCLGLAYRSQQKRKWGRLVLRAKRLRLRLGGSANLMKPFPERPPRMHRITHAILACEELELRRQIFDHLGSRLERSRLYRMVQRAEMEEKQDAS